MMRWIVLFGFALTAALGRAQLLYDSQGFEPPLFSPGSVYGQDSWTGTVGEGPIDVVLNEGMGGTSGARASHPGGINRSRAQRLASFSATSIAIDYDFRLHDDWFTGFATQARFFTFGHVIVGPGINDQLGVFLYKNGQNGIGYIAIKDPSSAYLKPFSLESMIGQFHHLRFEWESSTGRLEGFLDGASIVLSAYGMGSAQNIQGIEFGSWRFQNLGTDGTVDFDNFVVTAVPEPASISVVLAGCFAAVFRRRLTGRDR